MASIEPFPEPRLPWSDAHVAPSGDNVLPLREHALRYHALLNALPAAIYTTDAAGRLTFYNEACIAFSGRRPEIGTDSWCVTWRLYRIDGSPLPHDECPMAVALKEGRPIRGEEAIAERPDGTRIPFIPYPTPLLDDNGVVTGAINMLVDISHRKEAEERLKLLSDEVNHRANNLLTVVQAMVRMTQGQTVEQYRATLEGRLHALARAHGLLAESRWQGADLHRLVSEELAPYVGAERPRVWISGPPTPLHPSTAQSMALVIHELATNAAKYGALSTPQGEVRAHWSEQKDGLHFAWTESGGPPTREPRRRGVGTNVIEGAVRQLGGQVRIDWRQEGLTCEIISRL